MKIGEYGFLSDCFSIAHCTARNALLFSGLFGVGGRLAFWRLIQYHPDVRPFQSSAVGPPGVRLRDRAIYRLRSGMTDRYVEKRFLYLLIVSLLLHGAVIAILQLVPKEKQSTGSEPLMVDLQDLPELKNPAPAGPEPQVRRKAEQRQRVAREMAPKGEAARDLFPSRTPRVQQFPAPAPPPAASRPSPGRPSGEGEVTTPERSAREELFRPRTRRPAQPQLFPSATKLAQLEETYRRKYEPEVAEGATRFLNTDDILFGSFLRRFETAIYGVWRYPSEAAMMGIEGVTPVKITFNRRGEIVGYQILQSSGSAILDNEVKRTLSQVGPVGAFPRSYTKDEFNLIAFFQYGILRGGVRSLR